MNPTRHHARQVHNSYWHFDPDFKVMGEHSVPRIVLHLAVVSVIGLVITAVLLGVTPWVQTTSGFGHMTALDPVNRQHDIHSLVAGRVERWYVQDGDRVEQGEPIVSLLDNDPLLAERLSAELGALRSRLQAAELATTTAEIDYRRKQTLHAEGLAAQRELEQARIRVQELRAAEANATAAIARASVTQAQRTQQTVNAPSQGTVVRTATAATATYIPRGGFIASFLPDNLSERAVQLNINGRDVPLVKPGRKVRLQFDGWPAVQFSGWPSVAIGTFGGVVEVVDATAQADGTFRVFVVADPDDTPWPEERFLRYGAKARGWVLLDQVPLGYELWRQLNQFPPNFIP